MMTETPRRPWNFIWLSRPPHYDREAESSPIRGYNPYQVRGTDRLRRDRQGHLSVLPCGASGRSVGIRRTASCVRDSWKGGAGSAARLTKVSVEVNLINRQG